MAKNRNDFQRLAELRLKEARALQAAGFPEGAYYLAGYAVECALKACIAGKTQQHDFPDKRLVDKSYSHDVEKLLDAAGTVREWSEQSRYDLFSGSSFGRFATAQLLVDAVESEKGGVLRWIKQSW
jgi:HEPN domain-containing protein